MLPLPPALAAATNRVIVSFERRITERERLALLANGILVGGFLGERDYNARVVQTTDEQLVQASAAINKILHVVRLDANNAYIKIDPALSQQLAPQSDSPAQSLPTGRSPLPAPPGSTNVTVQLWPEAEIEEVKAALAAHGEILRVSTATRKIVVALRSPASVQAIAELKGVQFLTPFYSMRSQNTRVRTSIGMAAAEAPQHQLSGQGVKIGIWDGGHVAGQHPSFTGRLTIDLARDQMNNRRDDEHATHVAGTIAGSGDYLLAMTSSTSGRRSTTSDMRAFGDELVAKPERNRTGRGAGAATSGGANMNLAGSDAGASAGGAPRIAPAAEGEPLEDRYPGFAAAAQLRSYEFNFAAEEFVDLLNSTPDAIDVVNNSWNVDLNPATNPSACRQMAAYISDAPVYDAAISGTVSGQTIRRIPVIFSAGNARDDAVCGMSTATGFPNYRSVLAPATAKNVITVGAVDADNNSMTNFSSWGPTRSGRLKPDIVAPGCRTFTDGERGIMSAVPRDGIGRMCGTSMAAPAVTGVVALMIEKMTKLGLDKTTIYPSTYKALLIHGATDLGRPGPDFEFGYGTVKLAPTLQLMADRAFEQKRIDTEGDVQSRAITVATGASTLKVTLAWDDRAAGTFSDDPLVNDLDLVLISPTGAQVLPFTLKAATGREKDVAEPGIDRINVVEQVLVKQPAAGAWRMEVRAAKIGSPTGGQTYSLVVSAN